MNNTSMAFRVDPTSQMPKFRVLLTDREKEIIYLIAHEYNDREIGKKLFLSHHTIHTHRKKLMLKLDVKKSTGLVRRGFELGLLSVLDS